MFEKLKHWIELWFWVLRHMRESFKHDIKFKRGLALCEKLGVNSGKACFHEKREKSKCVRKTTFCTFCTFSWENLKNQVHRKEKFIRPLSTTPMYSCWRLYRSASKIRFIATTIARLGALVSGCTCVAAAPLSRGEPILSKRRQSWSKWWGENVNDPWKPKTMLVVAMVQGRISRVLPTDPLN